MFKISLLPSISQNSALVSYLDRTEGIFIKDYLIFLDFQDKSTLFLKTKMKLKELLALKISSMLEIGLLSYFLIRIWFFNLI